MTEHFSDDEFRCNCCGALNYPENLPELQRRLELLRHKLGDLPVTILCGCRCIKHNTEVGGVPKSRHLTMSAADVFVAGRTSQEVFDAAKEFFNGVILYVGRHFCHCDLRPAEQRYVTVIGRTEENEENAT